MRAALFKQRYIEGPDIQTDGYWREGPSRWIPPSSREEYTEGLDDVQQRTITQRRSGGEEEEVGPFMYGDWSFKFEKTTSEGPYGIAEADYKGHNEETEISTWTQARTVEGADMDNGEVRIPGYYVEGPSIWVPPGQTEGPDIRG